MIKIDINELIKVKIKGSYHPAVKRDEVEIPEKTDDDKKE